MTPPKSKTATSTPRLSEFARRFTYPPNISRTVWPRVEAKGRELGLGFDWWQSQLGTVCLGYDEDGRYVATVGGIGLSIPRQVGKTYFVLALLVIMCILFPGLQVVWTAHHLRTSTKTFTTLRGICRRKKVAPHIKPGGIRAANGEQQVEFANGSMIMFGARSMGFGRGFDEIDIEVFDEAQILDTKALEDMIAATNQARHEHGALLFFMGTPPRPTDPSDAFTARRAESMAGESDDAIWLEIGADPASAPDDKSQYPVMNPSYPKRTPLESILRLRKNLKDVDSWNREGRGIWDELDSKGDLPYGPWLTLADPDAPRGAQVCFGADVAEDRSAWVAVAWRREDDDLHVMLANDGLPMPAFKLAAECKRLTDTWQGPVLGPKAFVEEFADEGVPALPAMSMVDFAAESGAFIDHITGGTIHHGNQAALNEAVRVAKLRPSPTGGERSIQLKDYPQVGPLAAAIRAVRGVAAAYDVLESVH